MSIRVAAVCYACAPDRGSEPGMAWRWVSSLRRAGCDVVVFTSSQFQKDFDAVGQRSTVFEEVEINFVDPSSALPERLPGPLVRLVRYRRWQSAVVRIARSIHSGNPFDVAHHISYASATQGVRIDELGVPTVLGPVGGAQFPPKQLKSEFPATWGSEVARRWTAQSLLANPFWRRRLRRMAKVFTSNRETTAALTRIGVEAELMLDDGSAEGSIVTSPRSRSGGPLRLVWVGRVFEIKALGLALEAVERASEEVDVVLEICGDGPDLPRHATKISELEATGVVVSHGWVERSKLLEIYDSIDVLLYTSLRDNGGEPLHRALERGIPSIVLDHQGPGAIVGDDAGVRVPIGDREPVVAGLASAIIQLADEPDRYAELSVGAIERARANTWPQRAQRVLDVYEALVDV